MLWPSMQPFGISSSGWVGPCLSAHDGWWYPISIHIIPNIIPKRYTNNKNHKLMITEASCLSAKLIAAGSDVKMNSPWHPIQPRSAQHRQHGPCGARQNYTLQRSLEIHWWAMHISFCEGESASIPHHFFAGHNVLAIYFNNWHYHLPTIWGKQCTKRNFQSPIRRTLRPSTCSMNVPWFIMVRWLTLAGWKL